MELQQILAQRSTQLEERDACLRFALLVLCGLHVQEARHGHLVGSKAALRPGLTCGAEEHQDRSIQAFYKHVLRGLSQGPLAPVLRLLPCTMQRRALYRMLALSFTCKKCA